MAQQRITQVGAEVVTSTTGEVRSTKVDAQAVVGDSSAAYVNDLHMSAIVSDPATPIRVTTVFMQSLYDPNGIALNYPAAMINMPGGV